MYKIIQCVEIITVLLTVSATRGTSAHFDRPVFDCSYSSLELYALDHFGGATATFIFSKLHFVPSYWVHLCYSAITTFSIAIEQYKNKGDIFLQ